MCGLQDQHSMTLGAALMFQPAGMAMFTDIGEPELLSTINASHSPQYIALFAVGIIAYRRNWFTSCQGFSLKERSGKGSGGSTVTLNSLSPF
jgi:hypothetical protein